MTMSICQPEISSTLAISSPNGVPFWVLTAAELALERCRRRRRRYCSRGAAVNKTAPPASTPAKPIPRSRPALRDASMMRTSSITCWASATRSWFSTGFARILLGDLQHAARSTPFLTSAGQPDAVVDIGDVDLRARHRGADGCLHLVEIEPDAHVDDAEQVLRLVIDRDVGGARALALDVERPLGRAARRRPRRNCRRRGRKSAGWW